MLLREVLARCLSAVPTNLLGKSRLVGNIVSLSLDSQHMATIHVGIWIVEELKRELVSSFRVGNIELLWAYGDRRSKAVVYILPRTLCVIRKMHPPGNDVFSSPFDNIVL